ncbi:pogo transposable element derived with ZNF domain b [Thalassophryne amazonica]|uniref:pogo transposable element derived with ZNF domain b n=1 Tax=Thalassophryne amazonica TaxID=390379 RepID=UPI001471ED10|nr:pogo transposable element derived with ZNF domain b [Thalassophryne amazonica]
MDTDLFMECEEEELEPWQQVDDSVDEDEMDFMERYDCVEDSQSPPPASETPPPRTPTTPAAPPAPSPAHTSGVPAPPPATSIFSPGRQPAPLVAKASPLILTQTASGTFLLPAAPGAGSTPPILLTTQGFPVQTMVNPVVLNLQRGQTVQPLTLIQSPSLGQLVRPGVSVPSVLSQGQAIQPRPGLAHSGSGFTTMQLPSTVTIRTSTPGPAKLQVSGANSLSASANGVSRAPPPISSAASLVTSRVTSTPPKVVMSVDDFYYGTFDGDLSLRRSKLPGVKSCAHTCQVCLYQAGNNLRLMEHTLLHSELIGGEADGRPCCQYCYRHFSSSVHLNSHQEQVHGPAPSTCMCRICEWAFENEPTFLHHMKSNHRPGEMPYLCQVCLFRSSFYSDVLQHFSTFHRDSRFLLCVFCLKVNKSPSSYQLHLLRHQKNQAFHCNRCRLQFILLKDKMQHKLANHRSFRRPAQLEGLPPGSKVTIRTYGKTRSPPSARGIQRLNNPASFVKPITIQTGLHKPAIHRTSLPNKTPDVVEASPGESDRWWDVRHYAERSILMLQIPHVFSCRQYRGNIPGAMKLDNDGARAAVSSRWTRCAVSTVNGDVRDGNHRMSCDRAIKVAKNLKTETIDSSKALAKARKTQTILPFDGDKLTCLECNTNASDFSAHYPTHVHCLLCSYSTCCSRAYAGHMIDHHVPRSTDGARPPHRRPPPCPFMLRCSDCDLTAWTADHMAQHLLMYPEHDGAICRPRTYTEPDIQFCDDDDLCPSKGQDSQQDMDITDLSWRSAECWKRPVESAPVTISSFTQSCGPQHQLSRNSDAIDFFTLLFPSVLMELITNETNAHAKTCQYLDGSQPDWVPVTIHEIKGFIGLVILMGIQNLPDLSHYWSWSHYDNSYTFYRAMSYKRFKQIAANIRMGSFTTDEYRCSSTSRDSLHIFRPMLDILGRAMWDVYRPNSCLTIDRALLPSLDDNSDHVRGKPKTQPQVWLLCDSKSGYCHHFFIQVGEKAGEDPGFLVVPQLMKDLQDKHHQLYLASSLASVPLMQKLLDKGIYTSCSFPQSSSIVPRELWDSGALEKPGDFLQWQFGPLLVTRWRDTKEMGCLSTNAASGEPDTVWRRSQTKVGGLDPIQRPMAFRLLQENMRGVDICKQLLACNPLGGIAHDRHWRSLFWFLVNLSIVNAFIVLRESRKENPPAWVQDGLFTQVNFRKRLGNQLAKCAQKYLETMEMASSRGMRREVTELPVKQRHRLIKVSGIAKRCKNCIPKNIRSETVYGCSVCKANLCKDPACFWEFHGLSPINKGSSKIGFVKDRISGEVEVDEVTDNMDESLAPVEEMDFSEDEGMEDLDDVDYEPEETKEELNKEVQSPSSHPASTATNSHVPAESGLSVSKEREDFLTARQLRIALFALCDGIYRASQDFSTEPQLIRSWLKEARKHLRQTKQEPDLHGEGGERLVAWVLSMREQQLPITESNLFHKASMLKKNGSFSDSFRISYDWAVSFMLQHRLGLRRVGRAPTLASVLPPSLDEKVKSFREFTRKLIQDCQLPDGAVATLDELCLFLDLSLVQVRCRRADALKLSASSSPLVTVYLTALADGTLLPSLVLAKAKVLDKCVSDYILLESVTETLSAEEALDRWTNRIWIPHLSGQSWKGVLVLDRHQEHMGDPFLTAVSESGALPAMIPAGCSSHLHPLEVCMKPVLQRFLLSRWATFTAGDPKDLDETSSECLQGHVVQLLVGWLAEALTYVANRPSLLKKSFHLTDLLPRLEEEEEKPIGQSAEESQSELLNSLSEALMGAEALKTDCPDKVELEDEESADELQEQDKGPGSLGEIPEREDQAGVGEMEEDHEEHVKDTEKNGDLSMHGGEEEEAAFWKIGGNRDENIKEVEEQSEDERKETDEDSEEGEGMKEHVQDGVKELHKDEEEDIKEGGEDSEDEGKEMVEDTEEANKERRETRIVIGEEVGDEWKITVKSRSVPDDSIDES